MWGPSGSMTALPLTRVAPLAAALALLLSPPLRAQTPKLGHAVHEDRFGGFALKYPDGWLPLPLQQPQKEAGMRCRFEGFPLRTKIESLRAVLEVTPQLVVVELRDQLADPTSGAKGEGREGKRRPDVSAFVRSLNRHLLAFDADAPVEDEELEIHDMPMRHRTWEAATDSYEVTFDTWVFHLADRDLAMVFEVPTQHAKKWMGVFRRSARSFELIEQEKAISLGKDPSYEEVLAFHEQEASRTPGWRVVPTPSRKFVIKTSSDDQRFIDEVIERLEASRELFEEDFPPEGEIQHVSVVRVCANEEEFQSYGDTPPGVAGWFNPQTTELVLYDNVARDRNATYAVMTHEAFHQYCHFLFDRSEAHRWFDEGHGDYYGGVKFSRHKAKVTPRMPGGLNRLDGAKRLVREGTYAPLAKHLNASHGQWQNQGPDNVSCYEQSWSIVYMLREGMRGRVNGKVWKDEYAEIIPNYVSTLYAGFQEAYAEQRTELRAEILRDGGRIDEDELAAMHLEVKEDRKKEIWKAAMDASWGRIDLDEFEENWKTFVKKYL